MLRGQEPVKLTLFVTPNTLPSHTAEGRAPSKRWREADAFTGKLTFEVIDPMPPRPHYPPDADQ
ncbi:hypothetical protein [Candidatus Amarolinea dominans]|uniref:hypothetical protein n=1 Tax=Candidatus Amarolinea dominans TaxID=3140696 RepID=UPI001E080FE9|nr:hypothetical protein [Anaerolineae bacterium]